MKTIDYIKEIVRLNLEDYFVPQRFDLIKMVLSDIDDLSYQYEHPYAFSDKLNLKTNVDCMNFLYNEISSLLYDSLLPDCDDEKLKQLSDIIKKFIFNKSRHALINNIQELESKRDYNYPDAGDFAPSDIENINEQIANINGMISLHDSSYKDKESLFHYIKEYIPEECSYKSAPKYILLCKNDRDELNNALDIIEEHNSKLLKAYTNQTHCDLDIPAYENARKKIRNYINGISIDTFSK